MLDPLIGIMRGMKHMPRFLADLSERVLWTAVQAGLGIITVESLHVPTAYAALVAAALAIVKGWVARHVGDKDSASTAKDV